MTVELPHGHAAGPSGQAPPPSAQLSASRSRSPMGGVLAPAVRAFTASRASWSATSSGNCHLAPGRRSLPAQGPSSRDASHRSCQSHQTSTCSSSSCPEPRPESTALSGGSRATQPHPHCGTSARPEARRPVRQTRARAAGNKQRHAAGVHRRGHCCGAGMVHLGRAPVLRSTGRERLVVPARRSTGATRRPGQFRRRTGFHR